MKDKMIRIIATKKQYKSGKIFMIPVINDYENNGRVITGMELATKEEVEWMKESIIDFNDYVKKTIVIKDGDTLNLQDPTQYFIYLRCLICSEVCNPGKPVNDSHLFYLHDEELVADKEYENTSKAFKAMTYIADKTEAELRDLAIYIGIDVRNTKTKIWTTAVHKKAIDEPELILKFKEAPNKDNLIFAHKVVQYNLVSKNRDGYFYKGAYLGNTIEAVINELSKEANKHIVSKLSHGIKAVEDPGSESLNVLLDNKKDERTTKVIEEKNMVIAVKELQYDYLKLTGKEYDGPMVVSELQKAVEVETKIKDFMTKASEMDEAGLRKSLPMRGVNKELVAKAEKLEDLITLGVEHIRING